MGEVFLSERKSEYWKEEEEKVVWKISKDPEYLKREYMALLNLRSIQEEATLEGNEYTPAYYRASVEGENFAAPFFLMEYVPGKDVAEIIDEIKFNRRPSLKEEEVKKILLQIAHLSFLVEEGIKKEKGYDVFNGGELSITGDFKLNRIKIYDESNLRIKIIDWSLPGVKKEQLHEETRKALRIIGGGMSSLLGGIREELPEGISEEMRAIILKCLGTQKEKFPPYQTFTDLYEDLKKS